MLLRRVAPASLSVSVVVLVAAALAPALLGCTADPPILSVDVTTGYETDAMTRKPAVTRVDVVATSVEGDRYPSSAAPGGSLDFGDLPSDIALTIEVTGVDATGATVLRGRSLSGIYLAGLSGDVIPVFAQRTGSWARPPSGIERAHVGAAVGVLGERYLLSTGGAKARGPSGDADVTNGEYYDLFSYGPAEADPFPRAAASLVAGLSLVLLVDDKGATLVDYDAGTAASVSAPSGLGAFADVAGGQTVLAGDGSAYVIGGTRTASATRACLHVASDGTLSYVALAHPRAGAAALWVDGVGVVVAGGAADVPGVEVLADGAMAFAERGFPPDPTVGAGASVTGLGTVALVGGTLGSAGAPTRTFDPKCSSTCPISTVAMAAPDVAITGAAVFATATAGKLLAIGDEVAATAMTHAYSIDVSGTMGMATELALREPRSGARAVAAPNGTLVIVGGLHADGTPALTIESFFP